MDRSALHASPTRYEIVAWILAALALFFVLYLHLLPALLAGLLVYELVHILVPRLKIVRLGHKWTKVLAVALLAVTVVSDEEEQEKIEERWREFSIDVPLEIVHSPYRELTRPLLRFIDELDARYDNSIVTVVLPEFVVGSWWSQLLHNQSALFLKGRLLFRKGTVVTSVPYHLDD